jgi:hypothetical protein
VWKLALVPALSLALVGCGPSLSVLLAPREPTREAIAAPRRALTAAEQEAISAAVMIKLGDSPRRDFKWLRLVVRPHNQMTDYCALVSGDYVVGEYDIRNASANFRDFLARLTFDRRGTLSKVDVVSIGNTANDSIPTMVDAICLQDGYDVGR